MSTDSPEQPQKKLKLVLKTSPLAIPVVATGEYDCQVSKDGSSSPPRPSYSPVTPTLPHEKPVAVEKPTRQLIDEPPPLPLSLDENPDAIALKATITLLQMQRQQSLKDIRDLDRLKDIALEDPRGFADALRAGNLKKPHPGEITFDDVEYEDDTEDSPIKEDADTKFGRLPNAQNIARCPPIEWSKYHVMGKPLEDLHNLQKQYPGATPTELANHSARPYEVASPYQPFNHKLDIKKPSKGYGN